jgi:hypothetical protein
MDTLEEKIQVLEDVLGINREDLCLEDQLNYHVPLADVFTAMDVYAGINPWRNYPDERPTDYGKYEVYRAGCQKQHYQTWNNTAWAYDNKDITHWRKILPPV